MIKDQNKLAEGSVTPSTPTENTSTAKENASSAKETSKTSASGNAKTSGLVELYRGITALISGVLQISNSIRRVNKARKKLQDISKKDHVLLLSSALAAGILLAGTAPVTAESLPYTSEIMIEPEEEFAKIQDLNEDSMDDGWDTDDDDGWNDGEVEPEGNARTVSINVAVSDPEGNLWVDSNPSWGLTLFPQTSGASPIWAVLRNSSTSSGAYTADFSIPEADSPVASGTLRYTLAQTIGGNLPGDENGNPAVEYDLKTYTIDITFNRGYPVNYLILNDAGEGADVHWINFPRFSRNIKLTKVIAGTDSALAGAKLQIIKKNPDGTENLMEEYTTAALSHIITLPIGCDYFVREIEAPEGYALSPDAGFRINEDYSVTITDTTGTLRGASPLKTFLTYQDMPLTVTVKKIDEETNSLLSGATLSLIHKDTDELVHSWTSGQEEIIFLPAAGTYVLTEIQAPEGYHTAAAAEFVLHPNGSITISDSAGGALTLEGQVLTLANRKLPTFVPVCIQKIDERTGELLGSADLSLYKKAAAENEEDTLIRSWTSDEQTKAFFDLEPGTYYLRENMAPYGYRLQQQDLSFTILVDGRLIVAEDSVSVLSCEDQTLTLTNHPLTQICKIDSLTHDRLFGAELALYRIMPDGAKDETPFCTWTDTEDNIKQFDLPEGQWMLRENKAPNGYALARDTFFSIDSTGAISLKDDSSNLTVRDTCLYLSDQALRVTVRKTDAVSGTVLPGANLELIRVKDQTVVHTWTSQETDEEIDLPSPGAYCLCESSAPEGYSRVSDTLFEVSDKGDIIIHPDSNQDLAFIDNVLVLSNRPRIHLQILKRAKDSNAVLSGACLSLYKISDTGEDVTALASWITDSEPYFLSLDPGIYRLCETAAPDGYTCSSDHTFTVTEDGQILPEENQTELTMDQTGTTSLLILIDARDTVSVKLLKQDAENLSVLAGASLEIWQINPDSDEETLLYQFVSEADAKSFTVPVGFSYRIRETAAPFGYQVAAETTFTVDIDHCIRVFGNELNLLDTDTLVLFDRPDYTEISLLKVASDTKKALPGARLMVTREEETASLLVADFITGSKPQQLSFSPGFYRIHESTAPDGYSLCPDTFFILRNDHTLELPIGTDSCLSLGDGLVLTLTDNKLPDEVPTTEERTTTPPEPTTEAMPETMPEETPPEASTSPEETTDEEDTTENESQTEEDTTTTLEESTTEEETTTIPEETLPSETQTPPVETTPEETSSEEIVTTVTEPETTLESKTTETPSERSTPPQESSSPAAPILGIEDISPITGFAVMIAGIFLLLLTILLLALTVLRKKR